MATSQMIKVLQHLRNTALVRDGGELSDAELLECFISTRDESAFEAIVRRHGPLVIGVCRRVLRNPHDVDDAFQATFLVLVRKAASIARRAQLANWLYGVAYNTAIKARAMSARQAGREKQVTEMPEPRVANADRLDPWDDLQPLLDKELSRLPDKYRMPIVLCDLQGKSGKEAAAQLGWPEGTVSGRLSRGRAMLAKRLTRKGQALSAATIAILLAEHSASAHVPAALLNSTIQSACAFAAGQAVSTGLISAQVAALTEGVLKAMLLTKLKIAATGLLVVLFMGLGGGIAVHQVLADKPLGHLSPVSAQERERRPDNANVISGKVVAVGNEGKTITLETPGANRGDDPIRKDFTVTDKTEVTFDGVGPNAATPKEGLVARVTLKEGSTDVPVKIQLATPDRTLGARLRGTVAVISEDGKTITLENPGGRDPNAEKVRTEFKINDKTKMIYENMTKAAAKPTIGYQAVVWHVEERERGDNTASKVLFMDVSKRGDGGAIHGKLVAFAKDGNTITVEAASKVRGEGPTKTVIKLTISTDITYHGVPAGGAKLTEGYHARIWLEEGSTETATRVMLMKDAGGRR